MQLAYVFEASACRTIEQNDGIRIVERRSFGRVCTARLFSEARNLALDLGAPEEEVLCGYRDMDRVGAKAIDAADLAQDILRGGAEAIAHCAENRAYLQIDSLSGKTVRITYEDGFGVTSVEPVGCTLSPSDRDFLSHTPVLADVLLAPSDSGRMDRSTVSAIQLAWLFAPSLREIPCGQAQYRSAVSDPDRKEVRVRFELVSDSLLPDGDDALPPAQGHFTYDMAAGTIRSAVLQRWRYRADSCRYPSEDCWRDAFPGADQTPVHYCYCCTPVTSAVPRSWPADGRRREVLCLPDDDPSPPASQDTRAAAYNPLGAGDWFRGDLGFARLMLLVAAIGCFRLGSWIARRGNAWLTAAVTAGTVALILWLALRVHGCLRLAALVPFSNCILLTNAFPLGAAVLIGILGACRGIPTWRRTAFVFALALAASFSVVAASVPTPELPPGHLWSVDGICLQTAEASCSPCAAATLLAEHGIPANEPEMARLCLTRRSGTPALGLYRGLKLKTRGTPWDVEIFRGPLEELKKHRQFPVLLSVCIGATPTFGTGADGRRLSTMGGRPHVVVLFGFAPDGRAEIGDPGQCRHGRVYWSPEELKSMYRGEGLYLADRYARSTL